MRTSPRPFREACRRFLKYLDIELRTGELLAQPAVLRFRFTDRSTTRARRTGRARCRFRIAFALNTAPISQRRHRHAQPTSGFMLANVLRQAHGLLLEFLCALPSRHHFFCHPLLHTVKKLSNFLLYVESRQRQPSPAQTNAPDSASPGRSVAAAEKPRDISASA